MRTKGVALLFGAAMLWPLRNGASDVQRPVLFALAFCCAASATVDLMAFASGIVGPASVPSVAIRFAVAAVCLAATRGRG